MVELVLALIFIVLLAAGGFLLYLGKGDLPIEQLLPMVQDGLTDIAPGLHLQVEKASIHAGQNSEAFSLDFGRVDILPGPNLPPVASFRSMVLGFDWLNLLTLSFVPSRIEIEHPSLDVMHFADGRIGLNFHFKKNTENRTDTAMGDKITRLLHNSPYAFKQVRLTDMLVRLIDEKNNISLKGQHGSFHLRREAGNFSGEMALQLVDQGEKKDITGVVVHDPKQQSTRLTVWVKDLQLDRLRRFVPQLPQELSLTTPLDVVLAIEMDAALRPQHLRADIDIGKGEMIYPPYFPNAIPIDSMVAAVRYNILQHDLAIEPILLTSPQGNITAHVKLQEKIVQDGKATQFLSVNAEAEKVPISNLHDLWPQGVGHSARAWVTKHLSGGLADKATLNLKLATTEGQKPVVEQVEGVIDFHDVDVDYLPPMAPVKKVDGQARYNQHVFDILAHDGTLLDSKMTRGHITIGDMAKDDTSFQLQADVKGPLQDTLHVVASKPLEYLQRLGVQAEQFSGVSDLDLQLSFPLHNDLHLNQVKVQAKGDVEGLMVRHAVKDLDVSAEKATVNVDSDGLSLQGPLKLADAPVDIKWHEYFGDDAKVTTDLQIDGALTPGVLKALRLPLDVYVTGKFPSKVHIVQKKGGLREIDVQSDLTHATIDIGSLFLRKAAGVAGHAQLNVTTGANEPTTITNMAASWPGFKISDGMLQLDKGNNLQSMTLKNVQWNRSNVNLMAMPVSGQKGLKVVIKGDTLDLSRIWPEWKKSKKSDTKTEPQRFDLSVRAKKLFLLPDMPLQNVAADVSTRGGLLLEANVRASAGKAGTLDLQQVTVKDGSRAMTLRMQDAGTMLSALDLTQSLYGGTMNYNGRSTPQEPDLLDGTFTLKKFSLVKAPVLARLINALSPMGLLELLNGRGLDFETMEARMTIEGAKAIRLRNGKMTGASMGMTFSGRYYRDDQRLNINGTVVPMQGINKLAAKIPLLGRILTGVKGEGVLAATYKIKGPADNPDVSVNPLAVLAPGILRSLLFGSDDE